MAKEAGAKASRYHSPLRARQAAQTRRSVLDAALAEFSENGWAATTVPMIAKRADVSVDTVYGTFGTKSNLLMEVVELAVVGDDGEAPMASRDDFAALGSGSRNDRLRAGVRYTLAVYGRSLPILDALREAAASDQQARERHERFGADRHDLIVTGMELILGRAPGSTLVDALWALISPEAYSALVHQRGWTPEQAEDWFVALTKAAIDLDPGKTEQ